MHHLVIRDVIVIPCHSYVAKLRVGIDTQAERIADFRTILLNHRDSAIPIG